MDFISKKKGVTLIELLIGVLILSVLTAIAMPSYFRYQMKSHRSDGINALNSIQLQQEKYRGSNATYGTLAQVWGATTTSPSNYYNLAITNPTATGYTATATAVGSQANDTQSGTACSVLTLTVNGLNTTQTPVVCWTQ